MKDRSSLFLNIINSLLPVLVAFIVGGFIIAFIGEPPFYVYWIMLSETLFSIDGFLKTLHFSSPLILTGLAIAITFKANIFNMGVEGEMLGGAYSAAIVGFTLKNLNPITHIAVCLLVGIFFGILLVLIPAILKAYFKVNEMVVTLMLNYIIIEILRVLTQTVFREPLGGYVGTPRIEESAMFKGIGEMELTFFFFIIIFVFIIMFIVFNKSRLGYEITAMGKNFEFSDASGMNVRRKIIQIMVISGALSGLAGAGYMMSEKFKYTLDFSGVPGIGWDGMLIALLGRNNPIGILIAAIFYSALKTGADTIGVFSDVPKEIVGIIQGLIILFLSIDYIKKDGIMVKMLKKGGAQNEF